MTLYAKVANGLIEATIETGDELTSPWVVCPAWYSRGPRPTVHHVLRMLGDGSVVWEDPRTLAQAKAQKATELRTAAAAELMGYFDEIGELLGMLANGITPPAGYRTKVAAFRDKVQTKRAELATASTLAEIDTITW